MASRVTDVINERLPVGRRSTTVAVPRDTSAVQVVFDRTLFEDLVDKRSQICTITIRADGEYAGQAVWSGGRVNDTVRPLQRMLWSYGHWPIRPGTRQLEIIVNVPREFSCKLAVDFF